MMMGFGSLIWIVLIGGVIFLVMRGGRGGGGCCGGGGHNNGGHDHSGSCGHDHNTPTGGNHDGMKQNQEHQEQITDGKDPVCGMSVKDNSITSAYQGQNYSFCSDHCREKFDANPTDFIK